MLAVAERQSLETLSRDEKTAARTLAQAKDKQEQLNAKKAKLVEDEENARRRRTEVSTTETAAHLRYRSDYEMTVARGEGYSVE